MGGCRICRQKIEFTCLVHDKLAASGEMGCRLFQQDELCICPGFIPSQLSAHLRNSPALFLLSALALHPWHEPAMCNLTRKTPSDSFHSLSNSLTSFQALQLGQISWDEERRVPTAPAPSRLGACQLLLPILQGLRHHHHQPESLAHLAVVTGGQGAHGTDLTHLSTLNQPVVLWDFIWV